jgi:hypothetical protein
MSWADRHCWISQRKVNVRLYKKNWSQPVPYCSLRKVISKRCLDPSLILMFLVFRSPHRLLVAMNKGQIEQRCTYMEKGDWKHYCTDYSNE